MFQENESPGSSVKTNSLLTLSDEVFHSLEVFRAKLKRYLPQEALDSPWKNKQQDKMIATSLKETIICFKREDCE